MRRVPVRRRRVPRRQQPAPRNRDDLAAKAAPPQGHRNVHHGKPGAHDQRRLVVAQRCRGPLAPWIGTNQLVRLLLRRQTILRQHHAGHLDRPPTRQAERIPAAAGLYDIRHLLGQRPQPPMPRPIGHRRVQQRLQISRIQRPRNKQPGRRLMQARQIAGGLPLQPVGEMVRLLGERAHIRGAHVQQILAGPVLGAPAGLVRAFAQQNRLVRRQQPTQVQGRDDAGKSGANNRDRPLWGGGFQQVLERRGSACPGRRATSLRPRFRPAVKARALPGLAVPYAATGSRSRISRSMPFNAPRSASSHRLIAVPVAPARAVRPMRCT